jgi:hypothetical protein
MTDKNLFCPTLSAPYRDGWTRVPDFESGCPSDRRFGGELSPLGGEVVLKILPLLCDVA